MAIASIGSSGLSRQEISNEKERGPLTVDTTDTDGTGERVECIVGRKTGVPEGVIVEARVGWIGVKVGRVVAESSVAAVIVNPAARVSGGDSVREGSRGNGVLVFAGVKVAGLVGVGVLP